MNKLETKVISASTLSKIKHDFRELIQQYPFSQMVFVDNKEIHFVVYAVSKNEINRLRINPSEP